ncbi:ergothioneine biosynthesis protein EgtB [Piscinibacter terrae]|uniref:Ergothioneine biosynthesis protein EgtB n=1 Tax=Piscinibacter terrae TaxID=2496871 RepID=A0A3N7HUD0_9BURK|nr:ergothioneine biosynthesis protein EgtB [Albitalea terrae]RQP25948.1 ergothioneine biosynthesis protein EgtB [Albitalea terrae]
MTLARPESPPRCSSPLSQRYEQIRRFTLALAEPLTDEDCQVQSMPDASPTKWHLAHVTWFFETFILERFEPGFRAFEPMFRVLFNSYYQGVGERHPRPQRGLITSPTLAQVKRYRADVDARMLSLLAARPDDAQLNELLTLGLHHEQQHQELLLTDIKHALSFNPLHGPYAKRWPIGAVSPQPPQWHGFDGGMFQLGHESSRDGDFCFDNETPRHGTYLAPFELASRPVSNGEFMAFMDDDGYRRPELWLSMGWDWVQAEQRDAPLYWRQEENRWLTHTLQGQVEIDPHTPACHLSFFEAEAYARWAGARLPTEAEWELAARRLIKSSPTHGNFAERGAFHPLPASVPDGGEPLQMYGDVWEWTQSNYNPYPGYRPLPGAVGEYNGKFMCNQFVLRGGSCATPAGHVRASYRNFFPPDAQWQFTGLRLAR